MKTFFKFYRLLFLPLLLVCSLISCSDSNGGCDGSLRQLGALQSSDAPDDVPETPDVLPSPTDELVTAAPTTVAEEAAPQEEDDAAQPESNCVVWDCETDADCREPLVCDPDTRCCAPPPLPACIMPCGTDDDCPLPFICDQEAYCCEAPTIATTATDDSCDNPCDENGLCSNFLTCNPDTYCCEETLDDCGDFPACDQPEVAACGGCDGCSGGDWTCNANDNCCEPAETSECSIGGTVFCCGDADCPANFACTPTGTDATFCLNTSTDETACPRLTPPAVGTAVSCVNGGQGVCDAAFTLVGPAVCNGACCVP